MKWYFAGNVNGLRHAFYQIQAAVRSAKAHTQLQPVFLVDDEGLDGQTADNLNWLADEGVEIIPHRASMLDILAKAHGPDKMKIFSGHWLRCDIPDLETEEEYVLYTDIDVLFMRNLPQDMPKPEYVACSTEHRQDDFSYFNSGIMVINVPNVRSRLPDLRRVVEERSTKTPPHDDQGALNQLFRNEWLRLPPEWNWKPYWGVNDDALFLHFHGPKPRNIAFMQTLDDDRFGKEYHDIYRRNPEAYAYYLDLYRKYTDL